MFSEISQNSQENTCARDTLLKKRLWHRCIPVNFAKFLRTLFFTEHLWATASGLECRTAIFWESIDTIMETVVETNFRCEIAHYRKWPISIFQYFLRILTKFSFLEEDWAIGYNSINSCVTKCRILIGLCKYAFLKWPTIFLDWHHKTKVVPASFSRF